MERRTISELSTLYELEPSVRDIYVEGPTDRAFVKAVLRRIGHDSVQVREIDFVSISSEQLAAFGLGSGSRQRVIALALLLEQTTVLDLTLQVVCIADADDEAGQPPAITGVLLLYTDCTSMTVYSFDAPCIQWYLDVEALGFPLSGEDVLTALTPILSRIVAVRRTFEALGIACAIVDPTRDCTLSGHAIIFDAERFIERCAHKAGAHAKLQQIRDELLERERGLPENPRHWVNAEDFIQLLHWLIVRLRGASNTVAQHLLGRTLLLGIPVSDIAGWPLFRSLATRLDTSRPV